MTLNLKFLCQVSISSFYVKAFKVIAKIDRQTDRQTHRQYENRQIAAAVSMLGQHADGLGFKSQHRWGNF